VRWIERLETAAAAHPGWNDESEKSGVMARLERAKQVFLDRAN
jgi:hypothetical protein